MAIKNEQFLKELLPYSKMTVVPGVTVGDLNFASAQSVWSTGFIAPSSTDNFAANSEVQLFQAAIGDNGQGLASGQVMTRSQTNWQDTAGRLPANEVFIGIRCLTSVFKHTNGAVGAGGALLTSNPVTSTIQDVAVLYQIVKSFSWEYQTGDGIIRNVGPLASYPQAGGAWEAPAVPFAPLTAADPGVAADAIAVQNGYPCPVVAKELPIPFMFLPNITTRVVVKTGSPITLVPATSNYFVLGTAQVAGQFLAVRMTFQGYKLTMPV